MDYGPRNFVPISCDFNADEECSEKFEETHSTIITFLQS